MAVKLRSEAHITVAHQTPLDIKRWEWLCIDVLEIKPLLIRLTHGKFAEQLMCAVRMEDSKESVITSIRRLEKMVQSQGFNIQRTKIEFDIRQSEPIQNPAYYECHYKFLVPQNDVKLFHYKARPYQLAASRNVLDKTPGSEKWYLTLRLMPLRSRYVVQTQFELIGKQLKDEFADQMQGSDAECVAYDSNPELDADWIRT